MHRMYVRLLLAVLALLLMACNLVEWPSSATPEESDVQTRVAQDVAATLSALPTPTLLPSPTHTPIPPTDTLTPPTETFTLTPSIEPITLTPTETITTTTSSLMSTTLFSPGGSFTP